jgi:2'-5' RNA ligase
MRLFFALWPDDAARGALGGLAGALQAECGGRAVPAANIHLTLVFPGDVAATRLEDACCAAGRIAAPSFDFEVGVLGYWRHNRILWSGPAQCPGALRSLVAGLESGLAGAGFQLERRAYVPHITLLRNARRAPARLEMTAIRWAVSGFVLVQSLRQERGAGYEVLRRWPLAAGGPG